jgi:uncharacterized membrane protein (UPF0136 family)
LILPYIRLPFTHYLINMPPIQPVYDVPGFVVAALVFAGGAMGYIKKGSVASLAAGGGSGLLLGYGAWVRIDGGDVNVAAV